MNIETFFKLTYGLYIVSSSDNGGNYTGHVSNTVFQVTSDPPQIAICSNKDNLTTDYIVKSNVFSVSVIQEDVDLKFIGEWGFSSGKDREKFAKANFDIGNSGTPILKEKAIAFFECMVNQTLDVGTHIIFVGDVTEAQVLNNEANSLTYKHYREVIKGFSPKNSPTYIDKDKAEEFAEMEKEIEEEPESVEENQYPSSEMPDRYLCQVCGFIYDPEYGDEDGGIPPGTPFEDIPEDWICPVCSVGKESFSKIDE